MHAHSAEIKSNFLEPERSKCKKYTSTNWFLTKFLFFFYKLQCTEHYTSVIELLWIFRPEKFLLFCDFHRRHTIWMKLISKEKSSRSSNFFQQDLRWDFHSWIILFVLFIFETVSINIHFEKISGPCSTKIISFFSLCWRCASTAIKTYILK